MDCPVEENDIRSILSKTNHINGLHFNLDKQELAIDADSHTVEQCLIQIRKAGYEASIVQHGQPNADTSDDAPAWAMWTALVLAAIVEAIDFLPIDTLPEPLGTVLTIGLAIVAIYLSGLSTYRKGIAALCRLQLNINALMAVAVTGAFLIGKWAEAAMVMALFAVSEWLERRSSHRVGKAVETLLTLTPETAEAQINGSWQAMPVATLGTGTLIRVRPGQRIPVDGIIETGEGDIDQSPVTGESTPVLKRPSDTVYAGTINLSSLLVIKTTTHASETLAARIIRTVEAAKANKAPFERTIDRFATIYTPAIFVLALGILIICKYWVGLAWGESCYRALAILVIACPCALVISTPATLVSGLTAAARKGILIRGSVFLEKCRQIKLLALDKTGTITTGNPTLTNIQILREDIPKEDILALVATLPRHSTHPLSQAIAKGLPEANLPVTGFTEHPGKGISGHINGHTLKLGRPDWAAPSADELNRLPGFSKGDPAQPHSATLLADETGPLALFTLSDTIKTTSKEAINTLKNQGIQTVLLTGDNSHTAEAVAKEVGIDKVKAKLLPEDKANAIASLKASERGGLVAMAGDGINDAPALATADMGIAMGTAGTHAAVEAADIVIMNDDLSSIPRVIKLSKDTFAILVQNIALALGIKALFIILAVLGMATMWMAVFADVGTTLLVLFNGLRMLRK
jgi:Cd2+/Zn2+-exporting ATPase